jgi:hypothetical protein
MNIDDKVIRGIVGRNGRAFRAGRGRAWVWLSGEIQEALLDAEVMDVIRGADSADNQRPHTPAEITNFRDRLEKALAEAGYGIDGVQWVRDPNTLKLEKKVRG